MNANRRKNLDEVLTRIDELARMAESIREDVEMILEEEQDAFDNLPESLQDSERGERMQEAIDALENALDGLDLNDVLTDSQTYIEDAIDA